MAADSLAALGYRALVLTGARPAGQPGRAHRGRSRAGALSMAGPTGGWAMRHGGGAAGRDHGELCRRQHRPGGEAQLGAAGIAVTDAHDQPFRLAARGGLGAVMGSKGLKAILIRRIRARLKPPDVGPRRDHRLPQTCGVQRAHQGAAGLRHRLDGDADAEPGRAAHAQLQRRPLRRRRGAQRRSVARPDPGARRRGHARPRPAWPAA